MVSKVQKWGNSQGVRLPKHVLDEARISVGQTIEITAEDGQITVRKTRDRKFDLAEMVSRMPADHEPLEESFGPPVGKEEW